MVATFTAKKSGALINVLSAVICLVLIYFPFYTVSAMVINAINGIIHYGIGEPTSLIWLLGGKNTAIFVAVINWFILGLMNTSLAMGATGLVFRQVGYVSIALWLSVLHGILYLFTIYGLFHASRPVEEYLFTTSQVFGYIAGLMATASYLSQRNAGA